MINVEGGRAAASMAFHGAWKDILSGQSEPSLAIGVEKTFVPNEPQRRGRPRPAESGTIER